LVFGDSLGLVDVFEVWNYLLFQNGLRKATLQIIKEIRDLPAKIGARLSPSMKTTPDIERLLRI